MYAVIHGGFGDLFALDFRLTPEQRDVVTGVLCAPWTADRLQEFLPYVFKNIKEICVLNKQNNTGSQVDISKCSAHTLAALYFKEPIAVVDYRWLSTEPVWRGFFLNKSNADISKFNLPARFILLHPYSSWSSAPDRDLKWEEFYELSRFAKRVNLPIVVIGNNQHKPRFGLKRAQRRAHVGAVAAITSMLKWIDLTNTTTILEAVEIVKRATVFVGASSCWGVLAAAQLPATHCLIKMDDNLLNWDYCAKYFYPFVRIEDVCAKPITESSFSKLLPVLG
jgi:hypothetical protein